MRAIGAEMVVAVDLGSNRGKPLGREETATATAGPASYRNRPGRALLRLRGDDVGTSASQIPLPSMKDALLGPIDIMQQRIVRHRSESDPPDVLLTPHPGPLALKVSPEKRTGSGARVAAPCDPKATPACKDAQPQGKSRI